MLRTHLPWLALTAAWVAGLGAGGHWLADYQASPGVPAEAPAGWPAGSTLRPAPGRFTLLLFAHPHCPCTRASLEELAWLLARADDQAEAHVVFVTPPGAADGWGRTDLRRRAEAMPGVLVTEDEGGRQARLFGVETSGQLLLYEPSGRLAFRGGITAGRGHQEDNPARRAVLLRLTGGQAEAHEAAVFGCPSFGEGSPCTDGVSPCKP